MLQEILSKSQREDDKEAEWLNEVLKLNDNTADLEAKLDSVPRIFVNTNRRLVPALKKAIEHGTTGSRYLHAEVERYEERCVTLGKPMVTGRRILFLIYRHLQIDGNLVQIVNFP